MLLPDELVQMRRPHPRRQRLRPLAILGLAGFKERHAFFFPKS
jgi:hypothetical protein